MDCLLGAAGGMMLGAAFFGLLTPAPGTHGPSGTTGLRPVVAGAHPGRVLSLAAGPRPAAHPILQDTPEGISTSWRRSVLLVAAMALHHIPEGLAIGVGYRAAAAESVLQTGAESLGLSTALVLTLSIMLQNVPEGMVVATALRAERLQRAQVLSVRGAFGRYRPTGCSARSSGRRFYGRSAARGPELRRRSHGLCGG